MSVRATIEVDVSDLTDQQRRRLEHLIETAYRDVVETQTADAGVTGAWTREALGTVISRLTAEGRTAQAEAIRRAAHQGGVVSRDEVYQLGDYDAERSLKGFTRPVNRICQELRDAQVVPADAPDLLVPDYDEKIKGYQRARSFSVPADIIGLLS
jgi:hypothetical protein